MALIRNKCNLSSIEFDALLSENAINLSSIPKGFKVFVNKAAKQYTSMYNVQKKWEENENIIDNMCLVNIPSLSKKDCYVYDRDNSTGILYLDENTGEWVEVKLDEDVAYNKKLNSKIFGGRIQFYDKYFHYNGINPKNIEEDIKEGRKVYRICNIANRNNKEDFITNTGEGYRKTDNCSIRRVFYFNNEKDNILKATIQNELITRIESGVVYQDESGNLLADKLLDDYDTLADIYPVIGEKENYIKLLLSKKYFKPISGSNYEEEYIQEINYLVRKYIAFHKNKNSDEQIRIELALKMMDELDKKIEDEREKDLCERELPIRKLSPERSEEIRKKIVEEGIKKVKISDFYNVLSGIVIPENTPTSRGD